MHHLKVLNENAFDPERNPHDKHYVQMQNQGTAVFQSSVTKGVYLDKHQLKKLSSNENSVRSRQSKLSGD